MSNAYFPIPDSPIARKTLHTALRSREMRQSLALDVVEYLWGDVTPAERAERVLEEAVELLQAEGVPAVRALAIVAGVYAKPAGDPQQEAGGLGFSHLAYCAAKGFSADMVEYLELRRVAGIPLDEARRRHAAKLASGIAVRSGAPGAPPRPLPRTGDFADMVDRIGGKLRGPGR